MHLPPLVEPGPPLGNVAIERYSRSIAMPGFGLVAQRRLAAARVLVVGAGGLGSPVLLALAAAGVGTIGVIDGDVVELSNLQRQSIHRDEDIGRGKAASAVAAIERANPLVTAAAHPLRLDAANALEVLGGYDLVVDGTDRYASRFLVADAAAIAGLPVVWGAVSQQHAQVSVLWEAHGPGLRDLHPSAPLTEAEELAGSCAEAGVLGAVCTIAGGQMAAEVVKLVTGLGEPLLGRILVTDAWTARSYEVPLVRDPGRATVTELAPEPERRELRASRRDG